LTTKTLSKVTSSNIEDAIFNYQKAIENNFESQIEKYYSEIVTFYNPNSFKNYWWKKYGWIYDFEESVFNSDYRFCFMKAISNYKTKDILKNYGKNITGSGSIANYFRMVLQKHFSGIIKGRNIAKRNPFQNCPICYGKFSPLSTHILNKHAEKFISEKFAELNITEKDFINGCPFCPKMVPNRVCKTQDINEINEHIVKYHSSFILEKFKEAYPNIYIANDHTKTFSDYVSDETSEFDILENNINTDLKSKDIEIINKNAFVDFMQMDFTPEEKKIITYIMNVKNIKNIDDGKLNSSSIRMSRKKFNQALDSIKIKMKNVGLEN
jgi:hypothetical protein